MLGFNTVSQKIPKEKQVQVHRTGKNEAKKYLLLNSNLSHSLLFKV